IATQGQIGESYNVGGGNERSNLQVVQTICDLLDQRQPRANGASYRDLIRIVADRPGHDPRYAIVTTKLVTDHGWTAQQTFESGLAATVDWYLGNAWWWKPIRDNVYSGNRLGQPVAATV